MRFNPTFRRAISTFTAISLVGVYALSALLSAKPAYADDAASNAASAVVQVSTAGCRGASTAVSPDPCEGANEAAQQVDDKLIKPAMQVALLTALLNLATFVFDRLAYEAAIWVATGGEGETPLFHAKTAEEAWKDFGLDIAGDAIGELNDSVLDELNVDFDICAPENPLFKLSLQLGLKQAYQPQQPKCDFQDIRKNWDSFITTTAEQSLNPSQTVLKAFAEGFKPGKNELSAVVGLNLKVHQRVLEAKTSQLFEQVNSDGFKAVTDVVTGKVKTPSSVLQNEFQRQIGNSNEKPTELQVQAAIQNADLLGNMFLHVAGVFTNTLLSTLMNRIYTGLFDVQPDIDPFDDELSSISSRDDAADRFASLITVAPTQVENYNVLAEFVSCPIGPVTVRGINNCVMDSSFVSAVARAESGVPMTVQEAIDEGLINADWPLIPHEGDGIPKNQDPLCYSYGYCYGNLVKMRKARILPVGWEIAASRNDPSNPATLQEIIDGFDDCGTQGGGVDATHQWCHLIDPEWVLKYPETQCRALVNGELQISTLSPGRSGACVDTPSCISESNDGSCDGGFGYCVQENNVWRFRGDECPEQYASCLSFENTFTGDAADLLFNTVDQAGCNADNAGCEWYRTNKYYDDGGTTDDTSDDTYEWLPGSEAETGGFVTADREDDIFTATSSPTAYTYSTTGGTTVLGYDSDGNGVDDASYGTYAYQDRIYFNNNIEECSEDAAGCSEVYQIGDSLALNVVQNPSFEDDDDEDGQPDVWTAAAGTGTLDTSGSYSYYGTNGYSTAADTLYQSNIQIAPGNFYTLSFYARQGTSGDTVTARVVLTDSEGNYLDLAGTSVAGDCVVDNWSTGTDNSVVIENKSPESTSYEQYECVFTVPDEGNGAVAEIRLDTAGTYVDAVQLELGEDASSFTEGYNSSSPSTSYLLIPPDYLGCTGAATDPAECDDYTQVCEAQDVGCNLYTPEDGDPAVPAIASTLDECPSECVGYTTYKQEATEREDEHFPLYFIAERATACTSQYVGCDAFTNLDTTAEGGEGSESYTYLRACVTPEMAPGDDADNESSTYFTWEGSDAAGYQLVTWTLLKSDDDEAPCTAWDVQSESTLVCAEVATTDYETDDCDEHDDIFENPDCREFYDTSGNIHYRDITLTVAVDSDCHPYRFDDTDEDSCEASGGYWQTDIGDCRYFGLSDESTECPAAQAGCREFTGGAGRNATTVFDDDFEGGDLLAYDEAGGAIGYSSISNESVATDGHSMRIAPATADGTVSTYWVYLDATDTSVTYDDSSTDTQKATCTDLGWDISDSSDCEIDEDADGTVECTVENGDNGCGTLDDQLVSGKSYVLSFWAKGSSDIEVYMHDLGGTSTDADDIHDFVDPSVTGLDSLSLEGAWHSYDLGPIDSTDFENFDDGSVLTFAVPSGAIVYVDNVRLKSTEENVTLIKDSWIVPSTCDQTPDGVESDQYYLGCEAYTDQDGNDANLYQFSDLCSEEVVGCEAVYDTQNSDSAYGAVYNARCAYVSDDTTDDDTVGSNTACELDGETACAISAGESFCLFDRDGALPATLPSTTVSGVGAYYMQLGPEAVVVDSDVPMYLVDNGDTDCTAENVGCEEIGLPTYNQEKTEVTAFESAYYLNDPDSYEDILCEDSELFCEEWSSTQDGNFYFKDPVDQTCEYKTGVTIDGSSYYGWFKSDTTEPCYDDYVIAGEQLGIWRNGDDSFAGWAGTCSASYDLCTEFRDISDTSGTTYPAGTPYYFMDDDALSEEALTASEQCQGQVSQKEGCGLFYDTNDSELTYNTTASYIASVHADALFGDAPGSKQDPISCGDDGSGGVLTTPDDVTVNLCEKRCKYEIDASDSLSRPSAEEDISTFTVCSAYSSCEYIFDGSCYEDSDCPDLESDDGETVFGTCEDASSIVYRGGSPTTVMLPLVDDANRVLKVYRDRECSAWLSCQSAQVSWNQRTSRYETICDRVGLCTRYTRTGDTTFCTEWTDTDAVVLDAGEYAGRDVTWNGNEYSGYAIPEQLPIEHYDQVNISPETSNSICTTSDGAPQIQDGAFVTCEDATDCTSGSYTSCSAFSQEFRLAYNAGPCDMGEVGWQGQCVVGTCEDSGDSCSTDDDCNTADAEQCVVGYCQYVDAAVESCTNDSQCVTSGYPTCDTTLAKCVNALAPNSSTCVDDSECTSQSGGVCTPDALAKTGSCYNNLCLTDIEGNRLADDAAREMECRGYPETMSPFPEKVVQADRGWVQPDGTSESQPSTQDSQPYAFVYGFQSVDVCAPVQDENGNWIANDECLCSYSKVSYGTQAETRYYPTTAPDVLTGVCIGGNNAGSECTSDDGASVCGDTGSCAVLNRQDVILGWDGYCLEKDSSIQLYGSADEDDRACLTWLPVDQLSGSTDLYGKYLEAGYAPQDTYYCAQMEDANDLATSNQNTAVACAETDTAGHDSDWADFGAYLSSGCLSSVWCPDGYFAVMTGYGGLGYIDGTEDPQECDDRAGDADCPFFCVPKGSYKTSDCAGNDCENITQNSSAGAACLPPTELEGAANIQNLVIGGNDAPDSVLLNDDESPDYVSAEEMEDWFGSGRPTVTSYYSLMYGTASHPDAPKYDVYVIKDRWMGSDTDITFNDVRGYYDDCETKGIVGDHLDDFIYPFDSIGQMTSTVWGKSASSSDAFRDLEFTTADNYAACTAVVQTATVTADPSTGNYNYAWTDRTWDGSPSPFSISTSPSKFAYPVSTEELVFGKAFDVASYIDAVASDAFPMATAMCEKSTSSAGLKQVVGGPASECSSTYSFNDEHAADLGLGVDPRPYYDVSVGSGVSYVAAAGTDNEQYCATTDGNSSTIGDTDCECTVDEECNDGISCVDTDSDGTADTCDGGPEDENGCVNDTDCQIVVCAETTNVTDGTGSGHDFSASSSSTTCAVLDTSGSDDVSPFNAENGESSSDALGRLRQIFAQALDVWFFDDGWDTYGGGSNTETLVDTTSDPVAWNTSVSGEYKSFNYEDVYTTGFSESTDALTFGPWKTSYAYTDTGDGSYGFESAPSSPVVIAIGDCEGTHCAEDETDAFSVDGQSSGVITGDEGYENVTVSFYVEADEDQMPIRNIIVNWGDGENFTGDIAWPTDSYSGSIANSNFYKNHRGYDSDDESLCTGDTWGLSSDACESTYVTFVHNYVCSQGDLDDLRDRECAYDTDDNGNRRLRVSPCYGGTNADGGESIGTPGSCVYQPRVYVKDNWGWCTGFCDAGSDGVTGCYGDEECKPTVCPDTTTSSGVGGDCGSSSETVNPWINFDGYIEVTP